MQGAVVSEQGAEKSASNSILHPGNCPLPPMKGETDAGI